MKTTGGLSALCLECGLCCDGTLFRFLPVEAGEVESLGALALPVVTQSGRLAMALPCAKLEKRCCTVYEKRPSGCSGFVCHLGRRLELNDVGFDEALQTVREAQRRIEVLRAAWPGGEPLVQRATSEAAHARSFPEPAFTALEQVHAFLDEQMHWPEGG